MQGIKGNRGAVIGKSSVTGWSEVARCEAMQHYFFLSLRVTKCFSSLTTLTFVNTIKGHHTFYPPIVTFKVVEHQ